MILFVELSILGSTISPSNKSRQWPKCSEIPRVPSSGLVDPLKPGNIIFRNSEKECENYLNRFFCLLNSWAAQHDWFGLWNNPENSFQKPEKILEELYSSYYGEYILSWVSFLFCPKKNFLYLNKRVLIKNTCLLFFISLISSSNLKIHKKIIFGVKRCIIHFFFKSPHVATLHIDHLINLYAFQIYAQYRRKVSRISQRQI